MPSEMKPCPFCGSHARIRSFKKGKCRHVIGCINVECIIWLPEDISWVNRANYTSGAWADRTELINAWNRRTP